MEIIQEKDNLLLNRKEIEASVEKLGAPSKLEISKMVSDHFKKEEDCIAIEEIRTNFGTKQALIKARIYDSPELKSKFEMITKKQKAPEVTSSENKSG